MQRRRFLWVILVGMVVVMIVAVFWRAQRRADRSARLTNVANVPVRQEAVPELLSARYVTPVPRAQTNAFPQKEKEAKTNASHNIPLLAYRIKNTQKPLGELLYRDSAILLRNALFDASEAAPLEIPPHLKAQGDPGSYIVQASGAIDNAFLARLKAAGAEIISYIPNNAYLVRAPATAANQLAAAPETQAILPWEPYFKLDLPLLAHAVNNEPLLESERVSIVVFPGQREAGIRAIEAMGCTIVAEDGSPFGHQLITHPRPDSLVALAQLPLVQSIERHRGRVLANDLSRVRVSVATNTSPAATNYLGLTGTNVLVGINDTGVDASHPDLNGRVSGATTDDASGHGTHVGGSIASSGANSPPNGPGSVPGATFRGIAPGARLFSQRFDLFTGPASDLALQQNAARTNVLISNNSWGYGLPEYNHAAASYDAAVRDALPGIVRQTPMIFVFAAGNGSDANNQGQGFTGDEMSSPATAKNVISVGAIENLRNLTNEFRRSSNTNALPQPHFLPETDSEDQVASYSSRGNVGIGLEGDFGRFKPDVVAPGSWVISCRPTNWVDPTNVLSSSANRLVDQYIDRRVGTNYYFRTIPDNAIFMDIYLLRNSQSPATLPTLVVLTNFGFPATNANQFAGLIPPALRVVPPGPGQFHFTLVNTNSIAFNYDVLTVIVMTNDLGEYLTTVKNLNTNLAPYYRFESGTSMAAGFVSGTLALMQEFFRDRLNRTNVSPALYKAMLINGARSLSSCIGCEYDLQVRKQVNDQGWGAVRITNSIPAEMARATATPSRWPMIVIDQDPTNTLATGESHTFTFSVSDRAQFEPLMVTLVWTDPPGNPVASTKLVNDLDLIVTNLVTGDYYIGNNIPAGNDFNAPNFAGFTNDTPFDVVNNVENVYIEPWLDANYTVTVRARRVNVNAITSNTNGIRQDYALVISSGNSALTNTFTGISSFPIAHTKATDNSVFLQNLSNKVAMLNQRVGANSPQLPVITNNVPSPSDGNTNQWNFYVFNNTNDLFTNVAFFTFMSPDLSLPRVREADIDLYVSQNGALTNLDTGVLNRPDLATGTLKSLTRGGTELVVIPGAGTGEYFVGVKSEDQQAAEFAIFAVAQQKPFGEPDQDGNIPLDFDIAGDGCIPDGTPANPGGRQFFTIVYDMGSGGALSSRSIRRVVLTNDVWHDKGGDLVGTVTMFPFGGGSSLPISAVLNNHRGFDVVTNRFVYDDSGEGDIIGPNVRQSDGPGSLRDFEGRPLTALWQFTMVDNTPYHVGCVIDAFGLIEPQQDTNSVGNGIRLTIGPRQWRYTSLDVPMNVTNLQVFIKQESGFQLPVDVYIRRGARPTTNIFDKYGNVQPPGGVVEHGRYDIPSLQSGRYHIGIYNPNDSPVELRMVIVFQYSLAPLEVTSYASTAPVRIPDDLTTNFVIGVTNARDVADVKVGVRIDHPRLSDLVLHLVSPEGTRILLTENRGLSLGTNYGEGVPKDFIVPLSSLGSNTQSIIPINTSNRQGIVTIDYDFLQVPDFVRVYYEGKRIFDSGLVSGTGIFNVPYGPGLSTFVEIIVNEGGQPVGTFWLMTVTVTGPWNYAIFTDEAGLGGPIKFAFPPFSRMPTNITVFSNSFENVLAGIYGSNSLVDDWYVRSNFVGLITDPTTNAACTGTNLLALSHGAISRGITNLLPGREYTLNFGQRKISSSPTQSVRIAVPVTASPFLNVTSPPLPGPLPGSTPAVMVPKLRVCPGQDVVVISTNEATFDGVPYTAQGDANTNNNVNNFNRYGLIGCWSSHPTVLDDRTRASLPFYIGGGISNDVVIAAPAEPGDFYLFLGVNDDNYAGNAGVFDVDLRWAQCQLASADYLLGNTPVKFNGRWRTNWAAESLFFVGNPTTTNIGFNADHNSTILLDNIVIDEMVPSIHYLSEEPMAPLRGQTALGEWKLEVTDNRAGPPVVGTNFPMLLSWSLKFIFADGPNPIPLTNGVFFTRTITGSEVHYFVVNVPLEVNTNLVTFMSSGMNGGVELLYSISGLPDGTVPPDPIGPLGEGLGALGLSTNVPPNAPISPGRSYFLAIRNADPSAVTVNDYVIWVDFANVTVTPIFHNATVNGNVLPLPGTFLQTRNNSSLAVANMDYYAFDIGNSGDPFINEAHFMLTSADQRFPTNLNMVLKRAMHTADHFPTPTLFDYQSTEPDTAAEFIYIKSNSIPVNLGKGRWYIGVYNTGTTPMDYRLTASEYSTTQFVYEDLPLGTSNNIPMAVSNYVLKSFNINRGGAIASWYHFATHETNAAVLFEIADLSGDVDLIVRRSDFPSRDLYDFSFLSTNGGPYNVGYEPVPLRTNLFIPTLGVNTNWYLAIANRTPLGFPQVPPFGPNPVTGMLCVKVFTDINPLVGCAFRPVITQPINPGGAVDICWEAVPGVTNDVENSIDMVNWVKLITNFVPTVARPCVQLPTTNAPTGFYRIVIQ